MLMFHTESPRSRPASPPLFPTLYSLLPQNIFPVVPKSSWQRLSYSIHLIIYKACQQVQKARFGFRSSNFVLVSDFDIRISNFWRSPPVSYENEPAAERLGRGLFLFPISTLPTAHYSTTEPLHFGQNASRFVHQSSHPTHNFPAKMKTACDKTRSFRPIDRFSLMWTNPSTPATPSVCRRARRAVVLRPFRSYRPPFPSLSSVKVLPTLPAPCLRRESLPIAHSV